MIVNGGSYRASAWWADHLQSKENDRAGVVKSYGFRSEDILEMLQEVEAQAQGTRCDNFFYQMNISPAHGERLTDHQCDRAREIAEKHHGFEGQPYFMVEHVKHGHTHRHIVWSRIDVENGRALSDSHDARKNHAIAREIATEFGLQIVISPYDREPGTPHPPRAPEPWEMLRGMKTGLDPRDIKAQVTELYQQSENGRAFHAALEQTGYQLVIGDRGLLILDSAGKEHSLARRISGVNKKELDAFMADVDRESLPTLEQGKAQFQDRKIAGLEADRATVRDEIAWEEAIAGVAIEKENIDERFLAPEDREVGRQEKESLDRRDAPLPDRRIDTDLEQLDEVIMAALLQQARRNPHLTDQLQLLAVQMPWEFAVAFNESRCAAQEAHARNLTLPDIDGLIAERSRHAIAVEVSEIEVLKLNRENAPALAYVRTADQQHQHETEIARLDELIYPALLEQALGHPRVAEQAQLLAWKMPHEFMVDFNENLAVAQKVQASNPDFAAIESLIQTANREELRRFLEADERATVETNKERLKQEFAGAAKTVNVPSSADETKRNIVEAGKSLTDPVDEKRDRETKSGVPKAKPKPFAPAIGLTAAGIRLAYNLTNTGQDFANAIEDRGLTLAILDATDADRLNKWERQRIKEQWEAPRPREEWMAQRGGVDVLTSEQRDSAQRSFDKWLAKPSENRSA